MRKSLSGPIVSGSRPASWVKRSARAGTARGARPATASPIARDVLRRRAAAAADQVHEAALGELAEQPGRASPGARRSSPQRVREPGVRVAVRRRCRRARRAPRRTGASRSAPSEQLRPTESGARGGSSIQNASSVWPERVRPLLSVTVTESDERHAHAALREDLSIARRAPAFAFSVSNSSRRASRSAPPSRRPADLLGDRRRTARPRRSRAVGRGRSRRARSRACGWWGRSSRPRSAGARASSRVHVVGGAARDARGLEVHLVGAVLEPVVGLGDARWR